MGWKPTAGWNWRGPAGHRVAVQATVIGLHLGILWLLQRPATPRLPSTNTAADARTGLRIRFLHIPLEPPHQQVRNDPRPSIPAPKHSAPARKTVTAGEPAPAATKPTASTAGRLDWSLPSGDADHGYIAHGPGDGTGFGHSATRIPGSGAAVVPGIRMIDPRTQGVAGAVRAVQALFGVADHHCVDVEAWRSLSTEELLDRHISPAQVYRTAETYHCY